MRRTACIAQAWSKEARLLCLQRMGWTEADATTRKSMGTDGATLEPLGGFVRTRESTIGAARNIVGGTIGVITGGQRGRLREALRVPLGFLDLLDTIPGAGADGLRSIAGTPSTPSGQGHKYNITRAIDHAMHDVRTDDPVNTIKDGVVVTADMVHAVLFKPGSDLLRAVQNASNN